MDRTGRRGRWNPVPFGLESNNVTSTPSCPDTVIVVQPQRAGQDHRLDRIDIAVVARSAIYHPPNKTTC